jgi:hypothetical protein
MNENIFNGSALGGEARKLLEALLKHVNEIGRAQVPTTVLLNDTGLTQGALVRARNELTQRKLLRTEPGFSASGLRGANVYVLNMTTLEPPLEEVPEGESGQMRSDDSVVPDQQLPDGVAPASGRHRSDRKSFLGIFRRKEGPS